MRYTISLLLFVTLLFVTGCQSKYKNATDRRKKDEARAEVYLHDAREALSEKNFQVAKEQIRTLRESCRFALEAREKAILLLDSVELIDTQCRLLKSDSLLRIYMGKKQDIPLRMREKHNELHRQLKFYERKLQHDKQQRRNHD